MSFISESLTIGLLLAIVFGAVCFYLYTRVIYTEKRISLMENILLDIKMNQEQKPLHVLPPISHQTFFEQTNEHEDTQFEVLPEEAENVTADEEAEYAEVLNKVYNDEETKEEVTEALPTITPLSVNKYDSMTKEELLELVKKRGLRAGNRPGREKLISLLEKADETSLEPSGGSGSFGGLQEAVPE